MINVETGYLKSKFIKLKNITKIEFGDILLSLFLLTIVRQYLWVIPDNFLSWILSFILTVVLLFLHLQFKEEINPVAKSSNLLFAIMVILPLTIVYFMRAFIPDTSWDVLNYQIIAGERAFKGFPFIPGDYFPTGIINTPPSSYMFEGIFRKILGYRLGTLGNFLILLWTAQIVDKFLRGIIFETWKRYIFVFLVLSCEYCLFEINNYMVDLLAVPLLLEVTWVLFNFEDVKNKNYNIIYICFLFGLSFALKLTNLAFIIPLFAWMVAKTIKAQSKLSFRTIILSICFFLSPVLPYFIFMYIQTSNPIFPFYNKIFHSDYWPLVNSKDGRFGPQNILETIFWPILSTIIRKRLTDLNNVYSGRLAITFIASLGLLLIKGKPKILIIIWLIGGLLWGATTGFIRYGLYLEILGGIIITYLIFYIGKQKNIIFKKVVFLLFLLLIVQSFLSYLYVYSFSWRWGRLSSTIFHDYKAHLANLKYIFRDYSLNSFLPVQDKELIEKTEVWVSPFMMMGGFEVLLKNNIPIITIHRDDLFQTSKAVEKLSYTLDSLKNRRMIAICPPAGLDKCIENIKKSNLNLLKLRNTIIPFFGYPEVNLYVMEISLVSPDKNKEIANPQFTLSQPLPSDAFKADILIENPLTATKESSIFYMKVKVKNMSNSLWPAKGATDGKYKIGLAYHWLDKDGKVVVWDGLRTQLPYDLKPGEEVILNASVKSPDKPGDYILELDMVQERVAWFKEKGSKTAIIDVIVR